MMKLLFLIVLQCFLLPVGTHAQQTLGVHEPGAKKHYYFPAGEAIRIKVEGRKEPVSAPGIYR